MHNAQCTHGQEHRAAYGQWPVTQRLSGCDGDTATMNPTFRTHGMQARPARAMFLVHALCIMNPTFRTHGMQARLARAVCLVHALCITNPTFCTHGMQARSARAVCLVHTLCTYVNEPHFLHTWHAGKVSQSHMPYAYAMYMAPLPGTNTAVAMVQIKLGFTLLYT